MQNNTSRTSPHVRRKREKRRTRAVNKTNPNAVSATETTVSNDVLAVRKFHRQDRQGQIRQLENQGGASSGQDVYSHRQAPRLRRSVFIPSHADHHRNDPRRFEHFRVRHPYLHPANMGERADELRLRIVPSALARRPHTLPRPFFPAVHRSGSRTSGSEAGGFFHGSS